MTENGFNKIPVKRSHSPESSSSVDANNIEHPFKKAKEEIMMFKEQSPPAAAAPVLVEEEEILDTLPPPTSASNLQSLNSNSRLSTPPLAVVKNSIRVNIGCCTKK